MVQDFEVANDFGFDLDKTFTQVNVLKWSLRNYTLYHLNKFWRSYSFCIFVLMVHLFLYYICIPFLRTFHMINIFWTQHRFFWHPNVLKYAFIFEIISFKPIPNSILTFKTFQKCRFLSKNPKLKIFIEISMLVL